MTTRKPTYEEMEARLCEAESIIEALRNHEVDAIIGDDRVAMVRLREVEEGVRQVWAELEQRVKERTTELAEANQRLRATVEEQEQTQKRLEETQRRLLEAQQIAHLGNWEWDPAGDGLWWSDEAYRLFGVEPGQVKLDYGAFLSFVHPEDRDGVRNKTRDVLENKRSRAMGFRIIRPDGQERHMLSETKVTPDDNESVVRLMGTIRDITEDKQAAEHLERTTAQLREQAELLDLAHDMIFVHDMEGRIIFWNRGAEHGYGWKREEALGQLSHRLLQTEYNEPLIRITAKIIRDGCWEGELTHTTRNGTKVTVATRWALRRGPDARPVAVLEIDTDITQRKQAEREMAEARRFAESIVDTIRDCLVVLDSQLRVISANRSFHEMFGTTREQVEGRFFPTLNGGLWDVPELRHKFQQVLMQNAGFEGFEMDCDLGTGSGTLVLGAHPVREQIAGAGLILLVIQDLTLCRRQEREIRKHKQHLASLTEELMRIEECQRRQIAQTLHDSVGESLVQIEQDLKSLISESPAAMRDPLRRVCEQVSRSVEWTRNLALELSPFALYAQGLTAAMRELADQFSDCEGFTCRVRAADESISLVLPVRTMLYRAVRELLVNVARHAEAEHVDITLDRDERYVRITVEDDGKGFDPSALGSGLADGIFGISSVRERLTRIGGEFTVDSVEGRGTRVILMAPLALEYESDRGA